MRWIFLRPGAAVPEVFLTKGVLKTYSKFTGEHPCQSVTYVKAGK